MTEEEYKNSPWYTARPGDVLRWAKGRDNITVALLYRDGDSFTTGPYHPGGNFNHFNNFHYRHIAPGWIYDETTLVKKLLEEYEMWILPS
jgi:hypothetical protein